MLWMTLRSQAHNWFCLRSKRTNPLPKFSSSGWMWLLSEAKSAETSKVGEMALALFCAYSNFNQRNYNAALQLCHEFQSGNHVFIFCICFATQLFFFFSFSLCFSSDNLENVLFYIFVKKYKLIIKPSFLHKIVIFVLYSKPLIWHQTWLGLGVKYENK